MATATMTDKRILVVDDDDAIRALLKTLLRRRGFSVDVARNGLEALERLAAGRYTLVVLDLMMPIMNGFELLERLGTLSAIFQPRVLVLTAGLEPRVFDPAVVVGTIHKPFDLDLFVDTVSGFLIEPPSLPPEEAVPVENVARPN